WRPLDAFAGRITVDRAAFEGIEALRRPETEKKERRPLKLPDRRPDVAIRSLTIKDARVATPARPVRLDGAGRLAMGGRRLELRFDARSEAGDRAAIDVAIDPTADGVVVAADVAGPADGALAALSGAGGAIDVSARGAGPPERFRIDLAAELGRIGRVDARLFGDVSEAIRLDIQGAATLQNRGVVDAIGPRVVFAVALAELDKGWRADVRRFDAEAGTAVGAVEIGVSGDGRIETALARFDVRPGALLKKRAPSWVADAFGDAVRIDASSRRRGAVYATDAALAGGRATLRLTEVATRDGVVGGIGALDVAPSTAGPALLREGGEARALFRRDAQGSWRFENASAAAKGYGSFSGDGLYVPASRRIEAKGLASVKPAVFQRIGLQTTKDAAVKISVSGQLDALDLTLDAALPAARQIPASRLQARLQGSFRDAAGRLAWTSGAASASASLALSPQEVRLDALSVAAPDLSAAGWARWNRARGRIETDIRYAARGESTIWPGVAVGGDGALKGAVAFGSGDGGRLDARFDRLIVRTQKIDAATVTVEGPRTALSVSLAARRWAFGAGAVDRLSARADLDLPARRGDLRAFSATAFDAKLALVRPAPLRFADGLAVDGLSLA
ncbi:MAG: hypothetical protein K2Q06_10915, partial [Parvularculaceae bacterium]|nr:hypothetical protein [Parvularculaceae bacterium]